MSHSFLFDETQFNRLFPFFILLNRELKITATGQSLQKICPIRIGEDFRDYFSIPRPLTQLNSFDDLLELQNQLIVIEKFFDTKVQLRGQFEYVKESGEFLFIGSPWFHSMEQVKAYQLQISDFAQHDPLIDLLHVLKAQEISNEDLRKLASNFNLQKIELRKATKEVQNIALFPMQNPDPLIRINFNGDILLNNPAAALLDFFEYENQALRNDEFFKIVATKIDKENPRWTIESVSDGRLFSFLCVTMKDVGYINIYGRDITEKKKDEDKLARLSLVASANKNGVLFTDPSGKITWANDAFFELTGYTLEEVMDKSPVELFKGAMTDESTVTALLEAFFTGRGFSTDIIYYKKDKSWFWGRSVAQPLKNDKGDVTEYFGIIQDISAEKTIEEKLKVLSQIAEDNINAVIITDAEGKITWVNKSFAKMTGYTIEEVVGQKPGQLLQGADTDKSTIEYLSTQIKNGEPFNTEIANYTKTGNKYWLRIQGQPIKNEKNQVTGFFALEEDITKEKDSERRFRKALESIGDNVWEHDFETNTTHFSKSDTQFLGYTTEEHLDNEKIWWQSVHPDDKHLLVDADQKYKSGLGESHHLEYRVIHKNGVIRWILDRGVVIDRDINGKPLRITGTHTDITERKEFVHALQINEEKYRSIIANMNLGLMEMDKSGKIEFANQTLLKMTELQNADGFNALNFLSSESVEDVLNRMRKRTKGVSEAYEVQTNINGKKGWWFVSSAPKYDSKGEHTGSIVICLDITKQKALERELIESREDAKNLAKAKETFLANMSHEIRTPMNAIIGMGNQLAKTGLNKQQNFYLNTIKTASENLLVIINDILDLSKIEAGKLTIEKIGFDPKKVVDTAVQVLIHKAEEKGLNLTASFDDTRLAGVLMGDPFRLNQILLNLISNAIKFTEKGRVEILCKVLSETKDRQTIQFIVKDTGIGIEKEFIARIFDKFSQENDSITRKYGGSGLGMSICRELIELMEGTIQVQSERGRGTEVLFTLPFVKGSLSDLPVQHLSVASDNFLQGKTIMVTDDNELNRLVASTILENCGATIVQAVNGEQAVSLVKEKTPDLILMDIQMPIMNGYETALHLRSLGYTFPVVAMTANAIKGELEKCMAAGMNDYISKPFKEEKLLEIIAHWLQTEHQPLETNNQVAIEQESPADMYDISGIKEISQGNNVFLSKMLKLFIDQGPSTMKEILLSYEDGNLEKVQKLAHRLKPSIDMFNIKIIKHKIREIEKNAVAYGKTEQLLHIITEVKVIIDTVAADLTDLLPTLK